MSYVTCPELGGQPGIGYNVTLAGKRPRDFADPSGILVIADCRNTDKAIRSLRDIDMTRQIVEAATPLGIAIHDHIIIGKDSHASLKGLKLI